MTVFTTYSFVKYAVRNKLTEEIMKKCVFILLMLSSLSAFAASPAGLWKTIDDETGKEKSLVRISEDSGVVSGRIEKLLEPEKKGALCVKCRDDRRGKPIEGLTILTDLKKTDENTWEKGEILDPAKGKVYTARIRLIDGGKKLELRGYLGPFYRTQVWIKAE